MCRYARVFFLFFISINSSWAGFWDFLKPPKAEVELTGLPFYSQKGTKWCWAAVSQMAIQYKKAKRVPQCKLVSEATKQACCIGSLTCDEPGRIEPVVTNYNLNVVDTSALTNEVDEALRRRKVPVMRLYNENSNTYHFAIIQAKYEKNGGYRIYDPFYGIISLSQKEMNSRRVHEGMTWVLTKVIQ